MHHLLAKSTHLCLAWVQVGILNCFLLEDGETPAQKYWCSSKHSVSIKKLRTSVIQHVILMALRRPKNVKV